MKVAQIHAIVNTVAQEILGETAVLEEDLSNIVTLGKEIIDTDNIENYTKKLINHIGKVIFVDRVYNGSAPSVMVDAWEYGSILEKVSCDLPDVQQNESWSLTDGETYSQDIFYKPKVSAKFFNGKVTFEIPLSIAERQVKESFSNATQLNGFLSMIVTSVENAMTINLDALIMRTINNFAGQVVFNELYKGTSGNEVLDPTLSTTMAINLLKLYNDATGNTLKKANALTDAEFIRFATYTLAVYTDRMAKISTLFNLDAKERFTPKDRQKVVLLSDFARASQTFLVADTFNADKVSLPEHDSVSYWQGSGLEYAFSDVSKIMVQTANGKQVEIDGLLGVVFDNDALGVSNLDRRVTTSRNARAEFYNNYYKLDVGFYNDTAENFVLFYIGEEAPTTP